MKKQIHILLFLVAGCFSGLSAQNLLINMLPDSSRSVRFQNDVGIIDLFEIKYFSYDLNDRLHEDISKANYDTIRNVYTYDAQNFVIQKDIYHYDLLLNWKLYATTTYEYDAQGRKAYQKTTSFVGNPVPALEQAHFYFDDVTYRDSSEYQIWDAGTQSWKTQVKRFTQYRPDGKIRAFQQFEINPTTDTLDAVVDDFNRYYTDGKLRYRAHLFGYGIKYQRLDSFIYDTQGRLDSFFNALSLDGGITFSHSISDHMYDTNGDPMQILSVEFNPATGNWDPFRKTTIQKGDGYYSNDKSHEENFRFNAGQLVPNPYSILNREFAPTDPDHVVYHRNFVQFTTEYDTVTWYHLPIVSTHQPSIKEADCQFANPLPDGSYITCDAPEPNVALQVSLQDAFGRVVQSQQVMPGEPWAPYPGIVNGVYFMSVSQQGAYLGAKRVVIARE